jgi:hypothetical protein
MRGYITVATVTALLTSCILKGYCGCLLNLGGTCGPFDGEGPGVANADA